MKGRQAVKDIVPKKHTLKMKSLSELDQIRKFSLDVWEDKSSTLKRRECVMKRHYVLLCLVHIKS